MLHFAYGSNMDRAAMRRRCPTAAAIAPARLDGWRFVITRDGYASIVPAAGDCVHGLLWQLGSRDLAALDAYEAIDRGLYRRRTLPVAGAGGRVPALVYVARDPRAGRPRAGYQEGVVTAARAAGLPAAYVRALERWLPGRVADRRSRAAGASA
jgi:gamma-glutamylcyclotransferase (GGCT)/AIG2-like uncharacterized protein YtfP